MQYRFTFTLALIVVFSIGCNAPQPNNGNPETANQPTNIILLIGDGMGLSQLSSAYYFGDTEPNFSKFPIVGLSRTSSSSHKITDSAAGATVFSSGIKTYNAAIGMDADTNAVPNIVEQLSEKGWNTGIVSTSSITHATPACFYAHTALRSMHEEIARQMVYSDLDFVAGGGYGWFANRTDSVNYLDSLTAKGFMVDTNSINSELSTTDKPVFLLAADAMPTMIEGRGDFLLQASKKAIAHLSTKPEPFMLMIEGSQIDWGGHANDADYLITELLDFDKTVGAVYDYAKEQGNTLVIITADHETGGFTLASKQTKVAGLKKPISDYNTLEPSFSTDGHSATMIPVLSFGPGSEKLSGIYQNTHVYDVMIEASKTNH